MKVLSVNPGKVYPCNVQTGFRYTILYQNNQASVEKHSREVFKTATIAKQMMREDVAHERKRHGLKLK